MVEAAEEMNGLLSDSSFVILGETSLASEMNAVTSEAANSQTFLNQTNSIANRSRNSWGSDPSSSEIQLKLDQLVKENNLLKETLNQSNLAMKNQFDTLVLWQQEVVKTHEAHKKKFLETQDQIMKLSSENEYLKKQMEDKQGSCETSMSVKAENDSLHNTVESLKKHIEFLDGKCREFSSDNEKMTLRNIELEKSFHGMREENFMAKKKLQELQEENNKLSQIIADTEAQLKSKSDVAVEKSSPSVNKSTELKQDVPLTAGANERREEQKSLSPDVSMIEMLSENMENMDISKSRITELEKDIAELKKELMDEKEISEQKSGVIATLKEMNDEVMGDYKKLQQEHILYKNDIAILTDRNNNMNSELKKQNELLEQKNRQIEEAKEEIRNMTLQCEEVAILRLQVDQYRLDFTEQESAKIEAMRQKEELDHRVGVLERALADANRVEGSGEGERISFSNAVSGDNSQNSRADDSVSASVPNRAEPIDYTCFNCKKVFRQLRQVQEHVEECLELTD